MNDLDLLRRVREDVGEPGPADLARARRLLTDAAVPASGYRGARRRPGLLVAACLAAVLVVAGGVVLWDPAGTAPASAAALLRQAGRAAADADTAGPGEYLEVTTRERSLGYVTDGPSTGAYEWTEHTTTYVPHDRTAVWVRRHWADRPGRVYGGPDVRAAAERDYAVSAHRSDVAEERAAGGAFSAGELGEAGPPSGPEGTGDLPRDPRALLDVLRSRGDGSQAGVLRSATELLRTGLVPRDLAPVVFEALKLLPDIRVVDRTVTLDGVVGTAVGLTDGDYAPSVILDPATGELLGTREVQLTRQGDVPAGTVSSSTSVSVRVVPRASAGQ